MIPPTPTNKSKTNFSIEWIVKSSESNVPKNASEYNIASIDSSANRYLPLDYDSEIFKALRLPANFLQHKDFAFPHNQPSMSPPHKAVSPQHYPSPSPPRHQLSETPPHQPNQHQFLADDRNNSSTQHIAHTPLSPQQIPTEFTGITTTTTDNNGQSTLPHSQQGPIRPIPFTPLKRMNMQEIQMQDMQTAASLASSVQHSEMVAAQLQLVAALAYRQQQQQQQQIQQQQHHHQQPSSAAAVAASIEASKYNAHHHQQQMQIAQMLNQQNCDRTTYPMSPWMINRHGRMFPRGYANDFFLHTFRKQKRIRTAFAPLQLLKLEHAFEGNQYVVGTERKALAKNLNLSETQVKVWFQNRRTKHKRLNQEDCTAGDDKDGECRKSMYSNGDTDADDIEIENDHDDDSVMGTEIIVQ